MDVLVWKFAMNGCAIVTCEQKTVKPLRIQFKKRIKLWEKSLYCFVSCLQLRFLLFSLTELSITCAVTASGGARHVLIAYNLFDIYYNLSFVLLLSLCNQKFISQGKVEFNVCINLSCICVSEDKNWQSWRITYVFLYV